MKSLCIVPILVVVVIGGFIGLIIYDAAATEAEKILHQKKLVKQEKDKYEEGYEKGYIQACKDFYQGKTKYNLIEKENGERVWEKTM